MIEQKVKRTLDPKEATALVGVNVPALAPSWSRESRILRDADSDVPVALVVRTPTNHAQLRQAILTLTWSETLRGSTGLRNQSRTFGYAPRKPVLRREGCSSTLLAGENPTAHDTIAGLSEPLAALLNETLPEEARLLAQTPVDRGWRLSEGGWTSGVINRSSALPYHRDGSNFNAWSAMPVVRRGVRGGHLHLPEYDVTLPCDDGYTLFFNGHTLVHGVTPMRPLREDAYRVTVVFYCLRGMKDCHTYAEETRRAVKGRTSVERGLAARIKAGDASLKERNGHDK